MQLFKPAPWDKMAVYVTLFYITGFVWVGWVIHNVVGSREFIIMVIAFTFLIVLTYAFCPRYYIVNSNGIKITRLAGSIIVPFGQIKKIDSVDNCNLSRSIGSGGTFGYYGSWKNNNGEKVSVASTRLDHLVMITTERAIFAISPDNPDNFVALVQSELKD